MSSKLIKVQNKLSIDLHNLRTYRLEWATVLRTFSQTIVFSAQLAEGGDARPPLSLHPPPPLEIQPPLHPLTSKTSEILLPVLSPSLWF
jgi:hypothetical protein